METEIWGGLLIGVYKEFRWSKRLDSIDWINGEINYRSCGRELKIK